MNDSRLAEIIPPIRLELRPTSITQRIAMVEESQKPPIRISAINPVIPSGGIRSSIVMLHKTSDS